MDKVAKIKKAAAKIPVLPVVDSASDSEDDAPTAVSNIKAAVKAKAAKKIQEAAVKK